MTVFSNEQLAKLFPTYSFTLGEVIAKGGCSTVYRISDDATSTSVLKVITHELMSKEAHREVDALSKLGLLIAHKSIADASGCYYAIVMKHLPGISIQEYLDSNGKGLSYLDRLKLTINLAVALLNLHSKFIIHGDISPANAMICPDNKCVEIFDFGWSLAFTSESSFVDGYTGHYWGWRWFTAPENLAQKGLPGGVSTVTPAVDVLALRETIKYIFGISTDERFVVKQPAKPSDGIPENLYTIIASISDQLSSRVQLKALLAALEFHAETLAPTLAYDPLKNVCHRNSLSGECPPTIITDASCNATETENIAWQHNDKQLRQRFTI